MIEALAERGPTVLVFEDLHWADEALLDFIDHLVEWASGVPLLVLCTARPELLERRKGWAGGKPNASTLALSPLSGEDTARLVAALLEQAVLPAETQVALLDRAEGNPLYAEEYVRMLIDREVLIRDGRHWRVREGEDVPLPESVQGIIAARLDALSGEEKALLQAASVLGKVFWLGAVEAIGGVSRWQAEEGLHRLERKEFVRRERQSSVEGESEYAFRHILVKNVAYGQLPRAERAAKHDKAAGWIESLAGDRGDRVEMLAHHYVTALDLTRASATASEALCEKARFALRDAGDHALALNAFAAAARFYASALELWPLDAADRAMVCFGLGKAQYHGEDAFPEVLPAARDALLAAGDVEHAAEAETMIAVYFGNRGDPKRGLSHMRRAVELVESRPPSWAKAWALSSLASFLIIDEGDYEGAITLSREALVIGEPLGLSDITFNAWMWIGMAKLRSGDIDGLGDLRRSVALAAGSQSPEAMIAYTNVADNLFSLGDLAGARALIAEAVPRSEALGSPFSMSVSQGLQVRDWYYTGQWEAATRLCDQLLNAIKDAPHGQESDLRLVRGCLRSARISAAGATPDFAAVALGRRTHQAEVMIPSLAFYAGNLLKCGQPAEARVMGRELLDVWQGQLDGQWALGELAYTLVSLGDAEEFREAASHAKLKTPWLHAALAITEADFQRAANVYTDIDSLPDEAYARLHAGKQLVEQGRRAEGEAELERSLTFWRRVEATTYIRECEALLARAASA